MSTRRTVRALLVFDVLSALFTVCLPPHENDNPREQALRFVHDCIPNAWKAFISKCS